ncbi:MAG: class I SAM-dependent methyltransferase [Candidatus Nanoarchaeia archaeon]
MNIQEKKRLLRAYPGCAKKGYVILRTLILDFESILKHIPRGTKKIKDVGCGYGVLSILAANTKKYKIVGSDIDYKRIDYLSSINNTKSKNLKFLREDAIKCDAKVDVIICVDLLHHLTHKEQKAFLSNIQKNAPKSVVVIIKDMDKGRSKIKQFFNCLIDFVMTGRYAWYYHDKKSFISLFERNNFVVDKVTYLNKRFVPLDHILFVLRKK